MGLAASADWLGLVGGGSGPAGACSKLGAGGGSGVKAEQLTKIGLRGTVMQAAEEQHEGFDVRCMGVQARRLNWGFICWCGYALR